MEKNIAEYIGANKAVCLNSATAAMELTLRILGIGPGDEVITCAYTYSASASVIDHVGAKIVLVDTEEEFKKIIKEALSVLQVLDTEGNNMIAPLLDIDKAKITV